MKPEIIRIIQQGEANGNGWIIRFSLPSGRELFGLATENFYGGDWDLGPTWNYVVRGEGLTLIDTGRFGMGGRLLDLLDRAGLDPGDLTAITLTHGHEDHDGGLMELSRKSGAPVWVHPLYESLRHAYPDQAPSVAKRDFSASCWHCFMPETFTQAQCREYHRQRDNLETGLLTESTFPTESGWSLHHLPGHCPDSLAFQIGDEALIVGDTLLPGITPHPSQEAFFQGTRSIFAPPLPEPQSVYGLRAYLRSLRKLQALAREFPRVIVLPAHRLYYNLSWGWIDLTKRVGEIVEHHRRRCADLLGALRDAPRHPEEIARILFPPNLLKGFGIRMAVNEVCSHLELLVHCGDIEWGGGGSAVPTGKTAFEKYIEHIQAVR